MNVLEINSLVLAYLGDVVYENYVRTFFIEKGIANVNDLQIESLKFVSAKRQAFYLSELQKLDFFKEDEIDVIHRARNSKSGRHPKSCDILTYKHATALEAVIGYLRYLNKEERIKEIMSLILGGTLC